MYKYKLIRGVVAVILVMAFSVGSLGISPTLVMVDADYNNENPLGAITITNGKTYSGVMKEDTVYHYYKFTLSKKSVVTLTFNKNIDYVFLDSSAQYLAGESNSLGEAELDKGTYYVRVYNDYEGSYSFSVSMKIAPTKITMPYKKKFLTVGQKLALKPTVYPSDITNRKVVYKSSGGHNSVYFTSKLNPKGVDEYRLQYDTGFTLHTTIPGFSEISVQLESNNKISTSFKLYIKPKKPKVKNLCSEKVGKHSEISLHISTQRATKDIVYVKKPGAKKYKKVSVRYEDSLWNGYNSAYFKAKKKGTYKIKIKALPYNDYPKKETKKCAVWSKVYKIKVK